MANLTPYIPPEWGTVGSRPRNGAPTTGSAEAAIGHTPYGNWTPDQPIPNGWKVDPSNPTKLMDDRGDGFLNKYGPTLEKIILGSTAAATGVGALGLLGGAGAAGAAGAASGAAESLPEGFLAGAPALGADGAVAGNLGSDIVGGLGAAAGGAASGGMNWSTMLKLLGINVGSAAAGALIGGKGNQVVPIGKGLPADKAAFIEPGNQLYNALSALAGLGKSSQDKYNAGTKLRTVAHGPEGFQKDPAELNPSLLDYKPGTSMDQFDAILKNLKGQK